MADLFDVPTRSRIMAAIGPKDSVPELVVRKFLHGRGFRFRLHVRDLPGRPDIVLPRYKTVIFVHGCFWHQHADCVLAATPVSNAKFWEQKLNANRLRDLDRIAKLIADGWRVGVFWECAVRKGAVDTRTLDALGKWLEKKDKYREFPALPLKKKSHFFR